jgi:hypothetical protein
MPATFTWRCRFCETLLILSRALKGSVITCPQCCQQSAISKEAA